MIMKFQELLAAKQINWDRVKLIRHNLTKDEVAVNYERGYLELYQSVQSPTRFRNCDMVISFLGTEGTNGVFQGCYQIGDSKPYTRSQFPEDFIPDSGMTEGKSMVYELVKTIYFLYEDRLVIDWGKGTINWCQTEQQKKKCRKFAQLYLRSVSSVTIRCYCPMKRCTKSFTKKRPTKSGKKNCLQWQGYILLQIPKQENTISAPPVVRKAVSGAGGASMPEQNTRQQTPQGAYRR